MNLLQLPNLAFRALRKQFQPASNQFELEAPARRLVEFNRRKWPAKKGSDESPVVLVGQFASNPSIFCTSYVANYLAEKTGSRIESYQFIGRANPTVRELYESFGARFALSIADATIHEKRVQAQAAEILGEIKTKWDVMNITVDGVLIGDQVYDSYLRFFNEPTVQLTDERLKNVLVQALRIFYAARDYLQRTKVTAFLTDDFSYINSGIITRLLHLAKVPVYLVLFGDPFWLLKLDPGPSGAGHNFPPPVAFPYYAYPRLFDALSKEKQTAALDKARHVLEERLSGKFCPLVRMPSTTYAVSSERVLHEHPEPRILVMMHDFVDSPHGFRDMMFPDFYEWVTFLLERASETPFRWYVKPHPCTADPDPSRKAITVANNRVMAELQERFPKITFLSPTASNQQILNDGVTAMFTVYGTAGHEYAYRGVPVVNCGDNPHIAYDFNIHAKTLEQYEACIRGADRLQVRIDPRAIEEFVYMHYFYLAERFGSRTNPIDERIFSLPDCAARLNQTAIYDEFIAGATPERERGIAEYFDDYFSQPDLMKTLETP